MTPSLAAVARGRWGEDQAARWYGRHGFEVLARNWRGEAGEIDLVVAGAGTIVFVEVKTRASERFGPPGAAVGTAKQRRLRLLAAQFLAERRAGGEGGREVRFDVVAITGAHVEVIVAAF